MGHRYLQSIVRLSSFADPKKFVKITVPMVMPGVVSF